MSGSLGKHWRALLLAMQFLTTVPVPRKIEGGSDIYGLSLLWYPAVGLLLGVVLTCLLAVLPGPYYLQAGIIVAVWVLLTGGLHLDGLADCADAWLGGLGDREKTLLLLKDPLSGSMAVIALVMMLLLKVLAVAAIIQSNQASFLWVVPLLARWSLLLLFLTTDYVRPQGLGEVLAQHFSRIWAWRVVLITAALVLFCLPFSYWLLSIAIVLVSVFVVHKATVSRLGGFTGDVAGAQVEGVEVALLLGLALYGGL